MTNGFGNRYAKSTSPLHRCKTRRHLLEGIHATRLPSPKDFKSLTLHHVIEHDEKWLTTLGCREYRVSGACMVRSKFGNWQTQERNKVPQWHHVNHAHIQEDTAFSGSDDQTAVAWNWKTGMQLGHLQAHSGGIRCLHVQHEILIMQFNDFYQTSDLELANREAALHFTRTHLRHCRSSQTGKHSYHWVMGRQRQSMQI